MTRSVRLTVTPLEDRTVPAVFGNTWVDTNLTVSFAPDGTDVAGAPSELFRLLGARATTAEWQGAVRAAFRSWAVPTNLDVSLVSDDGRSLGAPGPIQGSPFVGDIRITARPLSDNVLAISNPFDLLSPWAGEIIINSAKTFDTDGSAGAYDLRTVLLQEVGHVLGVGNSPDPASVMYEYYSGPRAGLSAGDVASIQGLYGARGTTGGSVGGDADVAAATASDWTAGAGTNDTLDTATNLGKNRDITDRRWDFAGTATFGAPGDIDVYRVKAGASAGAVLLVYVSAPGGLAPGVTVYDKNGKPVEHEVLAQNGDVITVQIQGVKKNQDYFVSVRATNPAAWAGRETYSLGIDFRDTAVVVPSFAAEKLTSAAPQLTRSLTVDRTQAFQFRLAVESKKDSAWAGARLTVFDATGRAVLTLVAGNGQSAADEVFLRPGTYTVVIAGGTADGSALKALKIDAALVALTDPIGPALAGDYGTVTTTTTTTKTTTTAATTTTTTAIDTGFFWLAPVTLGFGFLAPSNPFSSPWW